MASDKTILRRIAVSFDGGAAQSCLYCSFFISVPFDPVGIPDDKSVRFQIVQRTGNGRLILLAVLAQLRRGHAIQRIYVVQTGHMGASQMIDGHLLIFYPPYVVADPVDQNRKRLKSLLHGCAPLSRMLLLKSKWSDYTTGLLKCQQKSSAQPILFDYSIPRRGGLGAVFVLFTEWKSRLPRIPQSPAGIAPARLCL